MKRLNPSTNKPFKAGDTREDGYIFRRYAYSYGLLKNGYYPEQWYSPPALKKALTRNLATSKKHRRNVKAQLEAYKSERGCADCGYNKHPVALDFDHLPGHVKDFTIGSETIRNLDRIWKEVAKCEVVCANCHRIRTATRYAATCPDS